MFRYMQAKTSQVQLRVTPRQKAALKRRAAAAGIDVSAYVLARALPDESARFAELVHALADDGEARFALAELNTFLDACATAAFAAATADADLRRLTPRMANYVAAMVEFAAHRKRLAPPTWTAAVEPLGTPWFTVPLKSVRAHLLASAPVVFKRRNIFVDASVGSQV